MAGITGKLIDANSIAGSKLLNNAEIERSQLKQVPNAVRRITPFEWRVWDSGALLGTAGNDDLGIVMGTFGTDVATVQAGDLKAAGETTRYAITQVGLPDYYEDGQTVTVRLLAGMMTTVADNSCTVDVDVYALDSDGTPTGDGELYGGSAKDMNSLTAAELDFELSSGNLTAGDVLEIRVNVTCHDDATGTAVTPTIYKAALLFDARG